MTAGDRVLWTMTCADQRADCVMISCCSGAELQIRCGDEARLRELYPDKATLYERARQLHAEWAREGWAP